MNDTLPALPPDQTQAFHHHLNSIKPPIQFTIEEESLGTILFLDTMVTRHDNGSLSHHRVPQEDSYRPLSGFSSHHTLAHKVTMTHTMLTKQDLQFPARQRCGQGAFLQVLETTGYPKTLINQHWRAFPPPLHLTTRHAQGYYSPNDIDIPDPLWNMWQSIHLEKPTRHWANG